MLALCNTSRLKLVSVAEQAALSLTWSRTPKKVFLMLRPKMTRLRDTGILSTTPYIGRDFLCSQGPKFGPIPN